MSLKVYISVLRGAHVFLLIKYYNHTIYHFNHTHVNDLLDLSFKPHSRK